MSRGCEILSRRHVIAERVTACLSEAKGLPDDARVELDTPLVRSGLVDSLGMEGLVMSLEKAFGIRIDDEDLVPDNFDTVAAIASFIERKLAETGE
jgi:acyl carrier protein